MQQTRINNGSQPAYAAKLTLYFTLMEGIIARLGNQFVHISTEEAQKLLEHSTQYIRLFENGKAEQ